MEECSSDRMFSNKTRLDNGRKEEDEKIVAWPVIATAEVNTRGAWVIQSELCQAKEGKHLKI